MKVPGKFFHDQDDIVVNELQLAQILLKVR